MLSDHFIAQKQKQSQKILKALRNIDELLKSQIQNKTSWKCKITLEIGVNNNGSMTALLGGKQPDAHFKKSRNQYSKLFTSIN